MAASSGMKRRRRRRQRLLILLVCSSMLDPLPCPLVSASASEASGRHIAFLLPGGNRHPHDGVGTVPETPTSLLATPPFACSRSRTIPRVLRPRYPRIRRVKLMVPGEINADSFLPTATSLFGTSRDDAPGTEEEEASPTSSSSALTAGNETGTMTAAMMSGDDDDDAASSASSTDVGTKSEPVGRRQPPVVVDRRGSRSGSGSGSRRHHHRPRRTGRLEDELSDLARGKRPDGAMRAQELLHERLRLPDGPPVRDAGVDEDRDEIDGGYIDVDVVETRHFNIVLNGWAERGEADRAEDLLREMERMTTAREENSVGPDVVSYTTVMKAWLRKKGRHADRVQTILDRMEAGSVDDGGTASTVDGTTTEAKIDTANATVEPNGVSYATAIHAWVQQGEPRRAESVLNRWEERFRDRRKNADDSMDKGDDDEVDRRVESPSSPSSSSSSSDSRSGGVGADVGMNQMMIDIEPNAIAYDSIVRAWCRLGGGGGGTSASVRARGAERVLRRMIDAGHVPRTVTVNVAIDAVAKGRLRDGPERAEALLRMLPRKRRDAVGYTSVIDALARAARTKTKNAVRRRDVAGTARELLQELEDIYEASGDIRFKPRTITFNAMLNVLSKTARRGDVDSALEAEGILDRMEAASAPSSNATSSPASSASTDTSSPSSAPSWTPGVDEYDDARPDLVTYTSVIDCWGRVGGANAAERAEDILVRMMGGGGGSVSGSLGSNDQSVAIRPDTVAFTSVIDCWAKSGRADAGNRAESVLRTMLDARVRPNAHTFTSLINAWGNSGDAARAERVLRRMERHGAAPDVYAYTSVLNAWSKSREDGAARRAEAILERMVRLYEDGNVAVKPNVVSVTSVIDAWAKSREPDGAKRAEAILGRVERLYASGNLDVKPDVRSFTSVISAWARSCDPGKAGRAQTILCCMNDEFRNGNEEVRPNSFTYCAVLNACATTPGTTDQKRKALRIMRDTFDECRESGNANHFVYAAFLRACEALMSEGTERDDLVVGTFERCCQDGQLSDEVLINLRSIVSRSTYRRLLELSLLDDSKITANDLPMEWSSNTSNPRWGGETYAKRTR